MSSGEIVNLRRVRKHAARQADEVQAAENRVKHGRTKAEKAKFRIEAERAGRLLDDARRDRSGEDDASSR